MTNYIFPGTFDPVTFGHLAVMKKFLQIMSEDEKFILGVSSSRLKKPILSFDERFELLQSVFQNWESFNKNVFIEKIIGNTAEFINKRNAICIRGIRNLDDLRYESYWPVSRSSNHPIEIFLLIPIFEENNQYISSTFFKSQISDLLLKNDKTYKTVYNKLRKIAPIETINLFYKKYFFNEIEQIDYFEKKYNLTKRQERISCIIAEHNIVDYGQLEFIKNSLKLSDKLIIFIPRVIQHERIEFQERFNLLRETLKLWNDNKLHVLPCKELKNFSDISELFKNHKITQFFSEMREYHTRNEARMREVFDQMKFLSKINIDLIIILQENFRDISQPLLFTIGYDDQESDIKDEDSILNKYIPKVSFEVLKRFVKEN